MSYQDKTDEQIRTEMGSTIDGFDELMTGDIESDSNFLLASAVAAGNYDQFMELVSILLMYKTCKKNGIEAKDFISDYYIFKRDVATKPIEEARKKAGI